MKKKKLRPKIKIEEKLKKLRIEYKILRLKFRNLEEQDSFMIHFNFRMQEIENILKRIQIDGLFNLEALKAFGDYLFLKNIKDDSDEKEKELLDSPTQNLSSGVGKE